MEFIQDVRNSILRYGILQVIGGDLAMIWITISFIIVK